MFFKCLVFITLLLFMGISVKAGECGSASWYNEGSRTATGEHYNPHGLSAAHRYFPFGTILDVTSQSTRKTVRVRINDRGPAKWTGRFLDLSQGAASVIGMIHKGIDRVCINILPSFDHRSAHKRKRIKKE